MLTLAVSRGEPFLGRATTQGPVIYLALEEKRSEVGKHFKAMGATGDEPIYIYAATAPADALERTRTTIQQIHPVLLIVDPLFRFTRVKDGNDYVQVTTALEPLLALARMSGTHVLCVHHLGKGDRQGGDAILGSTAIFAAVDTAINLRRGEHYRTISTVQRYGGDLEETTLRFDPDSRTISLGASMEREEEAQIGEGIIDFLVAKGEPVTEAEIDEEVEGRRAVRKRALRRLVEEKRIERSGKGGKGNPFWYTLSDNPGQQPREPESDEGNPRQMADAADTKMLVPRFPHISREPEYQHQKNDVTPRKNGIYSGSQDFLKSPTIERQLQAPGNQQIGVEEGEI